MIAKWASRQEKQDRVTVIIYKKNSGRNRPAPVWGSHGCDRGGDCPDHLPGQPDRRVPCCCGRDHQTGTSCTCRRWFRWRLWTGAFVNNWRCEHATRLRLENGSGKIGTGLDKLFQGKRNDRFSCLCAFSTKSSVQTCNNAVEGTCPARKLRLF